MRTTFILATFVASVLTIFAVVDLYAQRPGSAPSSGEHVAVIDLGFIFKNHAGLAQGKARFKQDMEAAEANLKKEQSQLQNMAEKLKTFNPGTKEYRQLEEDLTNRTAALQARMSLVKKDFKERESKLYYTTYNEVNDSVKYYADRNSINLVLQFSGDRVDPNNPQSVMNAITNLVVYQRGVDITPIILDELNRAHPTGGPAGSNPAARKPTGGPVR